MLISKDAWDSGIDLWVGEGWHVPDNYLQHWIYVQIIPQSTVVQPGFDSDHWGIKKLLGKFEPWFPE